MRRKKPTRATYTLDQELLNQYRLGGWLKKNASWIGPVVGAASLAIPGIGPVAGAAVMGASSGIGGNITNRANQKEAQEGQEQSVGKSNKRVQAENLLNQKMSTNPQQIYAPTYADGGPLTTITPTTNNFVKDAKGNVKGITASLGWENDPNFVEGLDSTQRPHSAPVETIQSISKPVYQMGSLTTNSGYYRTVETRGAEGGTNQQMYSEPQWEKYINDPTNRTRLLKDKRYNHLIPTKANGGPINEEAFNKWYKYNTPEGKNGIPINDPNIDYDYRKYYEDAVTGKNPMDFDSETQHFPDTYKLPNHPSFSNQSIYYNGQNNALSYDTGALPWKDITKSKLIKKANGGLLQYDGQSHQGPNGGIPVDAQGNSSAQSGNKPVALTENKEVAWNSPNEGSYIFSENLGFSKEAQRIMKRYEKRLGKDFDKEDPISLNTMNKQLGDLKNQQEEVRQQEGLENKDMKVVPDYKKLGNKNTPVYTKGGGLPKYGGLYPTPNGTNTIYGKNSGYGAGMSNDINEGLDLQDLFNQNSSVIQRPEGPITLRKDFGQDAGWSTREPYGNARPADYTQAENIAANIKGIQGTNNFSTPANAPAQEASSLYTGSPWLQVGAGAASLLGNALMQGADRRNRPKSIALSRYTPKRVDYSESRRKTIEEAELDKANILRSIKGMGAGYMANATNAITGADRAKYNAVAGSMENEENVNVQMENEAEARNAEVANREQLINAQNKDAYQARQRQYGQNYGQTIANTVGAVAQERAYYDALNLNPYYDIVKDNKGKRWAGRTFAPGKRFKAKQ